MIYDSTPISDESTTSVPDPDEPIDPTAVTTEVTSGDMLFTTTMTDNEGQPIVEIVEPTAITTTFESGSVPYTTTVSADGGQPIIEVIVPTPSVPGLAYHSFIVPNNQSTNEDANATYFNHNPTADFAGTSVDIDFETDSCGMYNVGDPQGIVDTTRRAVVYQGYVVGDAGCSDCGYQPGIVSSSLTTYIWTGRKAVSNWSQDNFDCYDQFGGEGCSAHRFDLVAGGYMPITILWINFDEYDGARQVNFSLGVGQQKRKRDTTYPDTLFMLPTASDGFTYPVEYFKSIGN